MVVRCYQLIQRQNLIKLLCIFQLFDGKVLLYRVDMEWYLYLGEMSETRTNEIRIEISEMV